jgi:hypothetical protein
MELSQRSGKMPNLPRSILAPGRHMNDGRKLLASLTSLACFIMLSASILGVVLLHTKGLLCTLGCNPIDS